MRLGSKAVNTLESCLFLIILNISVANVLRVSAIVPVAISLIRILIQSAPGSHVRVHMHVDLLVNCTMRLVICSERVVVIIRVKIILLPAIVILPVVLLPVTVGLLPAIILLPAVVILLLPAVDVRKKLLDQSLGIKLGLLLSLPGGVGACIAMSTRGVTLLLVASVVAVAAVLPVVVPWGALVVVALVTLIISTAAASVVIISPIVAASIIWGISLVIIALIVVALVIATVVVSPVVVSPEISLLGIISLMVALVIIPLPGRKIRLEILPVEGVLRCLLRGCISHVDIVIG
jgi:hypothetical protein